MTFKTVDQIHFHSFSPTTDGLNLSLSPSPYSSASMHQKASVLLIPPSAGLDPLHHVLLAVLDHLGKDGANDVG